MKTVRFILFVFFVSAIPLSSFALENMSEEQLDQVTAKEGVTIFLEGKITVTQEFTNIGMGDNDGIPGISSEPGWLVMDSGGEVSYVDISLEDAEILIDVASTGSGPYNINGSDLYIPPYTSFVRFGLPENIAVNAYLANGYHLYANNKYSTVGASYIGEIRISDIQIHANSTPTALYIHPH